VEPGGQGVANAVRRGVVNVVQSMWSPQTVNAGVAAAVVLFDVVEHIEDDLQFLKGVHATLAPDGLVFITVPTFTLAWSYEDVHAGHFRRYTPSELHVLLQKAGFPVEFSSYSFCPMTVPIFLLRSISSFLGLLTKIDLATTTPRTQSETSHGGYGPAKNSVMGSSPHRCRQTNLCWQQLCHRRAENHQRRTVQMTQRIRVWFPKAMCMNEGGIAKRNE